MPTLIGEKRPGGGRLNTRQGRPVLEERYEYLVKADYVGQTRIEILQTAGLPSLGSAGPGGLTICKGKDAQRRESTSLYWDVSCDFSSEVDDESGENDPNVDPATWVPVYETKWEPLQEVVPKDLSGKAIVNSVGQPYETGLTITRKIPVWEFFQFETGSTSDETIIDRHECINSGTFKGREAETLLCNVLSSVVGFYYGQRRRLSQYQLKYNYKKWTHKRLDVGTTYLDENGDEKAYKVKDVNGDLVQVLGGLWGPLEDDPTKKGQPSGGFDTDGTPLADSTRENVGILEFDIYPKKSFSFLRI